MATAFKGQSLTTSPTTIFDSSSGGDNVAPCSAFEVTNDAASSGNVLVNVGPSLHKSGEFFGIPPGASRVFRDGSNGIQTVILKSDSTATAHGGIVARIA